MRRHYFSRVLSEDDMPVAISLLSFDEVLVNLCDRVGHPIEALHPVS